MTENMARTHSSKSWDNPEVDEVSKLVTGEAAWQTIATRKITSRHPKTGGAIDNTRNSNGPQHTSRKGRGEFSHVEHVENARKMADDPMGLGLGGVAFPS